MPTWVDRQGLYDRYGEEFIQKLAIRRNFDATADDGAGGYVASETPEAINAVIDLAIEDAKSWVLWKLSCCYNLKDFNQLITDGDTFSFILRYHIQLTITTLKFGGDCKECDDCKAEISELCNCKELCSDEGNCLPSTSRSRFSVEVTTPSCLPTSVCCGCGDHRCSCGR